MGNCNSSVVGYRDEKPLHYTLQIQSFSLLKAAYTSSSPHRYESQIFKSGGFKWKLAVYPKGNYKASKDRIYTPDRISLYLVSAEDGISTNGLEINVMFTFLVYNNLKDKYWTKQDGKVKRFHGMKKEWGFDKLMSYDSFSTTSNGFLDVDDCCSFGVDIFVMDFHNNGNKGEVLSFINQPPNYIHTWKFNNFSTTNKEDYYNKSDPFTVEGYNWKIVFCCKKGYLYLYLDLQVRELPQNIHFYVEYEMSLLSKVGNETVTKMGIVEYHRKRWSWGSKFVSLSNLMKTSKQFLHNDTLTAKVKIKKITKLETLI